MSALTTVNWLRQHPVARRHPLKAWGRRMYWQVRQRFTARPKLMEGPNGTRQWIYPHVGLTRFWYAILPDYVEMSFLRHYLRPGNVFFDIGSDADGYAVFAAGFGCRVIAFDPVPSAFGRLRENATVNLPECSIETVNLALGAWIQTLPLRPRVQHDPSLEKKDEDREQQLCFRDPAAIQSRLVESVEGAAG